MCNEYPGPRCSNHGLLWLKSAEEEFVRVRATEPQTSLAYLVAETNLRQARYDYNTTPDGIAGAKLVAANHPDDENAQSRYETFIRVRSQQIEALAEVKNGRARKVASLVQKTQNFYDVEEVDSIISSVRRNNERAGLANRWDKMPEEEANIAYLANLNRIETAIDNSGELDEETKRILSELRDHDAPTSLVTLKTYADALKALPRSQAALKAELNTISTLQNVPVPIARAYYDAYRDQYKQEFAGLDKKSERPDPPKEWVSGAYRNTGYQNDPASAFAPSDEASMYAMYRLRVDDKAIPDYLKTSKGFAAMNLNADPDTKEQQPKTSLIFYTSKGKKLGEYVPRPRSLKAEEPEIAAQLQGKIIVTENNHRESAWLKSDLPQYGLDSVPVLTLQEMSTKYLNIPSSDLKFICEKTGVDFAAETLGAETDTTMKAFIGMKKKASSQWGMKVSRKNAPALVDVPLSSRW